MPILQPSYSKFFDFNVNQFDHYLDTVLNKIEPFPDDQYHLTIGMTCLEDDIYLPKGLYSTGTRGIPIIFDSGCSVVVSPSKADFGDTLIPSTKIIVWLRVTVKVKVEGIVQWGFKDDNGFSQVVRVKSYYIPTSTVRHFSPQSYFMQE